MKLDFKHNVELKAETGKDKSSQEKKIPFLTWAIIFTVTISLAIAIYFRIDVRLAVDYIWTNKAQAVGK
jgi:hypothetical protein